ncbi:MAG TPA: hypothetical protein VJ065_02785 [Patescibacteria group bacterium]|nr:hypothetical protein [Patescibacteria group bacterium]
MVEAKRIPFIAATAIAVGSSLFSPEHAIADEPTPTPNVEDFKEGDCVRYDDLVVCEKETSKFDLESGGAYALVILSVAVLLNGFPKIISRNPDRPKK